MCGISGIVNWQQHEIPAAWIDTMTHLQAHRGPDATGKTSGMGYAFGHNRLSLVDLSAASNQPFENERYVLVYNGELYGFQLLRQQLQSEQIAFHTSGDTEVLFNALAHWGIEKTMARIRGMFAFSWYDKLTRRLVLARDRFGIKPLYYTQYQGYFGFASEVKALAGIWALGINPMRTFLSVTGSVETDARNTVFNDVLPLEPGTWLEISGAEIQHHKFYSLQAEFDPALFEKSKKQSFHQVTGELHELLQASVSSMMLADAPIGVFASGGLDSSVITGLAAKANPQLFNADVVGAHSEAVNAQKLARHFALPLHAYRFEPEMFLRDWARCTWHYEAPIISFVNAVPFAGVAGVAREHGVKAVLTGEASDELFLGYPALVSQTYQKWLVAPFHALKRLYNLFPNLKKLISDYSGPSEVEQLALLMRNYERQENRQQFYQAFSRLSAEEKRLAYTSQYFFREHLVGLLHRNDRMGMSQSIEARFPFLDEHVVHYGLNLHPKHKIKYAMKWHDPKHPFIIDKAPVRAVGDALLPKDLARKTKWGFGITGLDKLLIEPAFFHDGFVSHSAHLTASGIHNLIARNPYFGGKLASIEIFGRLYQHKESVDSVQQHILQHIRIKA